MSHVDHALGEGRSRLLVVAVPATALAVLPSALDQTGLPTLLMGTAIAVLVTLLALADWARSGRLVLPAGPGAWAVLAFLGAAALVTVVGGLQVTGVLGKYARFSGLLLYLSAGVLYLQCATVKDLRLLWRVAAAIVVAGGVAVIMGLLQGSGVTLLGLEGVGSPLIATFGNPNFFSAFIGITVPLAVLGAATVRWATAARVLSGLVVIGALVAAAWSRSIQGVLAAAVGVAVFGIYYLSGRQGAWYRAAQAGLAAVSAVGAAVVGAAAFGVGPFAQVVGAGAVQFRIWYWQAALGMFGDHPLVGVGMAQYSDYFRRYRPPEAFEAAGLGDATDAAHSVPLAMLANGGLVLALAYLAVIVVVAWAAVSGWRRLEGQHRLLLGGFAGAWVAYQVQSVVSIDMPALAYVHWVLAGCVVALGAPWPTTVTVGQAAGRKGGGARKRRRKLSLYQQTRVAGVVLLGLVALWGLSVPLRADAAAGQARDLAAQGRGDEALERLEYASDLAPWQSRYHEARGQLLLQMQDVEAALAAYESALAAEPNDLPYTVTTARLAATLGQLERAQDRYERAVELEPKSAALAVEAAEFYMEHLDQSGRARELIERALRLSPENEAAQEHADSLGIDY